MTDDQHCRICERDGIVAVQCEIDKIGRMIDTYHCEGYEFDRQSFASLAFRKPKA